MNNCIYCGDYFSSKGQYCSLLCRDLSHGKYKKFRLKCRKLDDMFCECLACKKAFFIQNVVFKVKEQHEQWLLAKELI